MEFKFTNGHALNLRLKSDKGFAQYNFGTYLVKQNQDFSAQPYAFYLKNQINQKQVSGAGVVLKYPSGLIHHVN